MTNFERQYVAMTESMRDQLQGIADIPGVDTRIVVRAQTELYSAMAKLARANPNI